MKRKIIQIDEAKCDGCGLCVPACHEGALQIIDGKAKLVSDIYCDGLGDCLGHCPQDAIQIIEREAKAFDEEAVTERMKAIGSRKSTQQGCPGARMMAFNTEENTSTAKALPKQQSELKQWPVQLKLVPTEAPFFNNSELLLIADCVPFAFPEVHRELMKGKALAIACPKLDNAAEQYTNKLAAIIKNNNVPSVTVARMEVPCCGGLVYLAEQAVAKAAIKVPLKEVVIGIRGDIK